MAVLLPNCELTALVLPHPWPRDARGVPKPPSPDDAEARGPFPGAAAENPDGSWVLRVDIRCAPLRAGDRLTDGERTWVVSGAPAEHRVPGVPDVDHIGVTATLDPPKVP